MGGWGIRAGALGVALAGLAALASPAARADRVVPKKGPAVRGFVTRTDTEILVNRYRSSSPVMTYGVVRFPLADVRRVEEELVVEEVVRRRADDLKPDDVAGRVGLATYAQSQKVRLEAQRLLEEALALDPTHAQALALYGGPEKLAAARRGSVALDPTLRKLVGSWAAIPDAPTREREARRLEAEHGLAFRPEVLERWWRGAREPKGLREDVPLTLRADRFPGAAYTIYVPPTYDPLVPMPLLFVLHGGVGGGKDGAAVTSRGKDATTLYLEGAARLGWILVAPNALAGPWSNPVNEPVLMAVLDEVLARYDVDLDRVHLAGHAAGGTGAWWFGSRHTDVFASVSPSASSAPQGQRAFLAARTALFVYHSADDPVTPVDPIQPAVDAMLDAGCDLVYLQLEDQGHGFPGIAELEMFDVIRVKRLVDARRTSAWARSSFLRPLGPDEAKAFPPGALPPPAKPR